MKSDILTYRHILTVASILGAITTLTVTPAAAQLPKETPAQFAHRTEWWREAKFGMFIHWGVYAVPADATYQDGKTKGIAEWYFSNKQMQMSEYQKFAPKFNPRNFDAHKWVATAKQAGMKYIVITSKHHDGFAMFGTEQNKDWNIVSATPFKRDPILELSKECRKQGIKLCFYHSIMDWHHPDYLPRRPWEKNVRSESGADPKRYWAYMKAQLKELISKYQPGVLWFDGEWEPTWTHDMGKDLYAYCRSLKPDILVNNRVDKGRQGMQGMNSSKEFAGDFGTPEQEIPPTGFSDGRLWESCMTMNDTWGFARNDTNWKSSTTLIRNLVDIAHKGGNFLLNVGPTDLGEFPEAINERLHEMGEWVKLNGASLYASSPSPFAKLPFNGRCTVKGNSLFFHVFEWPNGDLRIPGIKNRVLSTRVLATGQSLKFDVDVKDGSILIPRPKDLDRAATTIEVKLEGAPQVDRLAAAVIRPDSKGVVTLAASAADVIGETARYESGNGKDNIGYWTNPADKVTWNCSLSAGLYNVKANLACEDGAAGSTFEVTIGRAALTGKVPGTGSWSQFMDLPLGSFETPGGQFPVTVAVKHLQNFAVMNLRSVVLTPRVH